MNVIIFLMICLGISRFTPRPVEAGDFNCDGIVDLGDVVYLISYFYRGGPSPGC
jgi:hypothetical protein